MIDVRPARPDDAAAWVRMREALWPSEPGEETARIRCFRKDLR